MFFLKILRFITGYVIFTASGGFPERFLNLCALNGISIWDSISENGVLTAKTSISCYKKIRKCAKSSGMKLKAKEKHGLIFTVKPYINRKGLIFGFIFAAAGFIYLSSCIWTINVTGNNYYTKEQILSLAAQNGIYQGALRKSIDAKEIRERIKATADGISWLTINIDKTSAVIEVLEEIKKNDIIDTKTPCNIIASADGELVRLEVYTGQAATKTGNAVTRGDLLISGVIEHIDGTVGFVHARGNAVIRANRAVSCSVPYSLKCKKASEIKNSYKLKLFSLRIGYSDKIDTELTRTTDLMLKSSGKQLPVGIIKTRGLLLKSSVLTLSEQEAALLCSYKAFSEEMIIMKNASTESKTVKASKTSTSFSLQKNYINHEKCGIENYFDVENSTD